MRFLGCFYWIFFSVGVRLGKILSRPLKRFCLCLFWLLGRMEGCTMRCFFFFFFLVFCCSVVVLLLFCLCMYCFWDWNVICNMSTKDTEILSCTMPAIGFLLVANASWSYCSVANTCIVYCFILSIIYYLFDLLFELFIVISKFMFTPLMFASNPFYLNNYPSLHFTLKKITRFRVSRAFSNEIIKIHNRT